MGEPSSIASSSTLEPRIESLVLDAGPLVTQSPLRGLAKKYYIPPSVVEEMKDKRARDHLAWLQSEAAGCEIEIIQPGPEAMVAVTVFAKQTGDYSVLSRPDLNVLALTYALEVQKHGMWRIRDQVGGRTGQQKHTIAQQLAQKEAKASGQGQKKKDKVAKDITTAKEQEKNTEKACTSSSEDAHPRTPEEIAEDPLVMQVESLDLNGPSTSEQDILLSYTKPEEDSLIDDDEDDEETGGEWITPENITKHKNRALGLVTEEDLPPTSAPIQRPLGKRRTQITQADDGWSTVATRSSGMEADSKHKDQSKNNQKSKQTKVSVACMTGDYAVQNVLLQMGLSLVGIEGQHIKKVRSWVLRCHACFKICKDSDKKFCPQCGNATLLRTSVTSTAPDSSSKGGGMQVHLKKNFQYKNRGTIYSLPLPKAGKAGGARQSVPILREDQPEWQKAIHSEKIKREKEERALQKALERGSDSLSARYEDADELSMLLAGGNSKNRTISTGLPSMGIGRKNPNERRRRKV